MNVSEQLSTGQSSAGRDRVCCRVSSTGHRFQKSKLNSARQTRLTRVSAWAEWGRVVFSSRFNTKLVTLVDPFTHFCCSLCFLGRESNLQKCRNDCRQPKIRGQMMEIALFVTTLYGEENGLGGMGWGGVQRVSFFCLHFFFTAKLSLLL